MAEMEEMIALWICPDCHTTGLRVDGDYISCKHCGCHGNPREMKWCLKVPMFNPVDPDKGGQLYKDERDNYWQLMGYAPGCGREVKEGYCHSCRSFLPLMSDYSGHRSGKSLRA